MADFVDPRTHPEPNTRPTDSVVAQSLDQIEDLHRLCREGRIYEVEAWIRAGRPLQVDIGPTPRGRKIPTALAIAVALETGQHALAELLLCNGYDLNREPRSPFDVALEARRPDLADLLFAWGTDPHRVTPATLFATYETALFERFYTAGVDLTWRHALGDALAEHSSNKPLFVM